MKIFKSNHKERGATVIEMALVLPVFLLITLLIVDFCRYFWVKAALIKSTQAAARAAASMDGFEVNTFQALDDVNNLPPGPALKKAIDSFDRFYLAKANAERSAYHFIDIVANLSPATSLNDSTILNPVNKVSWASLQPYVYRVHRFQGNINDDRIADVAIVRPGEEIHWADEVSGAPLTSTTFHPGLCPSANSYFGLGAGNCKSSDPLVGCFYYNGNPCKDIQDGTITNNGVVDMESVYEQFPIMAEMRAEVDTIALGGFLKLFGSNNGRMKMTARAFAFREQAPLGSFPTGQPIDTGEICSLVPGVTDPCAGIQYHEWDSVICDCKCKKQPYIPGVNGGPGFWFDDQNLCDYVPEQVTPPGGTGTTTTSTTVPVACDPTISAGCPSVTTTVTVTTTTTNYSPPVPCGPSDWQRCNNAEVGVSGYPPRCCMTIGGAG